MKIINIVDRIDNVNFGIWNAAIFTANILKEKYGFESEIWFPNYKELPNNKEFYGALPLALDDLSVKNCEYLITSKSLDPKNTVIITHGVWRFPTRWGYCLKKHGFIWIYTPHGMLEPWGMKNKWLRKFIYFNFKEKIMVKSADLVRAVSSVEQGNLDKYFKNKTILIPNGTHSFKSQPIIQKPKPYEILFLGRLNFKKSVLQLIEAFVESNLFLNNDFKLKVVGPDDGELINIQNFINKLHNQYINLEIVPKSIRGQEKFDLLKNASFFILPSQSEGFPTSVVEAGMNGAIPIITDECNFPELFNNGLGIKTGFTKNSILNTLNSLPDFIKNHNIVDIQTSTVDFFLKNYSTEKIAEMQHDIICRFIM
ncbi:MAG: glycosyltransferase [Bacteroidales bacterium]|nr:glycosyltransferase [Bacteroidales bacterium]